MIDSDVAAARRAYVGAIACGAKPHVALDLAKAAYRARHPELAGDLLTDAVSRVLAGEPAEMAQGR